MSWPPAKRGSGPADHDRIRNRDIDSVERFPVEENVSGKEKNGNNRGCIEEIKELVGKGKVLQENIAKLQSALGQLNNMKIARIAAIQELKGLLSSEETPAAPEEEK